MITLFYIYLLSLSILVIMIQKKSKITVKHYLNKRAKAKTINGEKFYPLYLQLFVAGKTAQLKSKVPDYLSTYREIIETSFPEKEKLNLILQGNFTESIFSRIETEKLFPMHVLMNDEVSVITYIIKKIVSQVKRKPSLSNFNFIYDLYLKDIHLILDEYIKRYYLNDLNKISIKFNKKEDSDKLFKISDYFIHYIDWHNPFCDYYKRTCEALPTELSLVENHLNEDLKKNIKALLAFNSKNNFLIKYLDKIVKGRFPNPNYIDWIEGGKDFVTKEFIKSFGKQKANEYINSLDTILTREVSFAIEL